MNKLTAALKNAVLIKDEKSPDRFYLCFGDKVKYVFENGKYKENVK